MPDDHSQATEPKLFTGLDLELAAARARLDAYDLVLKDPRSERLHNDHEAARTKLRELTIERELRDMGPLERWKHLRAQLGSFDDALKLLDEESVQAAAEGAFTAEQKARDQRVIVERTLKLARHTLARTLQQVLSDDDLVVELFEEEVESLLADLLKHRVRLTAIAGDPKPTHGDD